MPTKMVMAAGITPLTPLEQGVDATWRLIADPALDGVSGVYFDGTRRCGRTARRSTPTRARALRELSERAGRG